LLLLLSLLHLIRIIVERFLVKWWKDLEVTLTTDTFVDTANIHRFDPPPSHMGKDHEEVVGGGGVAKVGALAVVVSSSVSSYIFIFVVVVVVLVVVVIIIIIVVVVMVVILVGVAISIVCHYGSIKFMRREWCCGWNVI